MVAVELRCSQHWSMPRPRCLLDASKDAGGTLDTLSVIYNGIVIIQRRIEAAGRSFHEVFEKPLKDAPSCPDIANSSKVASFSNEKDKNHYPDLSKASFTQKSVKGPSQGWLKAALEGLNLYTCLEVEESASLEEIKKQHKRLAKRYHPDKQPSSLLAASDHPQEDEETKRFLKIQDAYEILSNEEWRRQYDSALPFDNSIPEEADITEDTFYDVLSPVFARNARWSIIRPVPSLGTTETPLSEVKQFYSFWFDFKSWRNFAIHDEYDMHDAEYRRERRWMERENKKIYRKYLKDENTRIQNLVNLAYSRDPRIISEKRSIKAKRNEEKLARIQQIKAAEEEAQRLSLVKLKEEEEAQQLLAEAKKQEIEAKKLENRRLKQKRRVLRQLLTPIASRIPSYDIQLLCTEHTEPQLESICDDLCRLFRIQTSLVHESEKDWFSTVNWEGVEEYAKHEAFGVIETYLKVLQDKSKEKPNQKTTEAPLPSKSKDKKTLYSKQMTEWTTEEIGALYKGMQRFPGGVLNRWKRIADFIGSKSAEEVIEKSKQLSCGNVKVEKANDSWSQNQQMALEAALLKYPSSLPSNERWAAIASEVEGKSKQECLERCKQIRSLLFPVKNLASAH